MSRLNAPVRKLPAVTTTSAGCPVVRYAFAALVTASAMAVVHSTSPPALAPEFVMKNCATVTLALAAARSQAAISSQVTKQRISIGAGAARPATSGGEPNAVRQCQRILKILEESPMP